MGQTWYLAVEMQCFIITPLLIWPLWRFPKFGFGLISTFTVAGKYIDFHYFENVENNYLSVTGAAIGLAWVNDYPPTGALQSGSEGYMENYYVVPWVRIQAYLQYSARKVIKCTVSTWAYNISSTLLRTSEVSTFLRCFKLKNSSKLSK